jgi:PAS domain S-box-containing protein
MKPTEPDSPNSPDAAHPEAASLARVSGASRGERWFRSLVQNSSDIMMILEADGNVRYVSPAVERVLGYRPEDLVGTLAFDHVHHEDIEHVSKSLLETLQKPGI